MSAFVEDSAERKLASVRQVTSTRAIPDADKIEVARIDGWDVVIKKGEVAVGELVVYFEIDSFLPLDPRYEFLRASSYRKYDTVEGFRLKTIKLRGEISQGLVLPLSAFPELAGSAVGDDVTARLGVTKYEPPETGRFAIVSGMAKGAFPSFVHKTDAERIQNLTKYFAIPEFADIEFEVSVKLDGTSFTAYHNRGATGICSRNLELTEDETNTYWKVARAHNLPARLLALGRNLALQGEIIGEGVQGNPEGIQGLDLYVFSVFDIDAGGYLPFPERYAVLEALNAVAGEPTIKHVPVLGVEKVFATYRSVDALLAYAEGRSMFGPIREGLVFKSRPTDRGRVITFKAISNAFLLQEGKAKFAPRKAPAQPKKAKAEAPADGPDTGADGKGAKGARARRAERRVGKTSGAAAAAGADGAVDSGAADGSSAQ